MEGASPCGVVILTLIVADGVDNEGDGGKGTMGGETGLRANGELAVDSSEGSVDGSISEIGKSNSDLASRIEERIEMDEAVDTDDGVRDSVTVGTRSSVG